MILAVFPLVIAVVGLLMYALSSNKKVERIGEILFFVGMLWLVYISAARVVKF